MENTVYGFECSQVAVDEAVSDMARGHVLTNRQGREMGDPAGFDDSAQGFAFLKTTVDL